MVMTNEYRQVNTAFRANRDLVAGEDGTAFNSK
jgi:hypothetical protein